MNKHKSYINFLPFIFLLGRRLAELPFMLASKEQWKRVNT